MTTTMLANSVREEATEKRQSQAATLKELREERGDCRRKLTAITAEIHRRETLRGAAQRHVVAYSDDIDALFSTKPALADIPGCEDDQEVLVWTSTLAKLVHARDEAIKQRELIEHPDSLRLSQLKLSLRISEIDLALVNITRSIRGETPGPRGGISGVR